MKRVVFFLLATACITLFRATTATVHPEFSDTNDSLPTSTRMLSASQLGDAFQLLSQYSYGTIGECPDKYKMNIPTNQHAVDGFYSVLYSDIKIELGGWHFPSLNDYEFTDVECKGPWPATSLLLQRGETITRELFEQSHEHSASTLTLYDSLAHRFHNGNYWVSSPRVAPFNCSKNGDWVDIPWFQEGFTFLYFLEPESVPITFIGKVRSDGSERLVMLNMTGTIRYMIATADQTTCIYRSQKDVERLMNETRRREEEENSTPTPYQSASPVVSKVAIVSSEPTASPETLATATPVPSGVPVGTPNAMNAPSPAPTHGPGCNCKCPHHNSHRDRTRPGGPWYGPITSRHRRRRYRRHKKNTPKPKGLPRKPKSVPNKHTGLSAQMSWIWSWLWCGPQAGNGTSQGSSGKQHEKLKEKEDTKVAGESACFPGSAIVTTRNGDKRMDELRIGDEVLVSSGGYSKVFLFTHRDAEVRSEFVALHSAQGRRILLTRGHFIRASGRLKRADHVEIGDEVTATTGAHEKGERVVRIESIFDKGLYNPQTIAGDIVVDGVLASCYTAAMDAPAAQAALLPLRALFRIHVDPLRGVFDQGSEKLATMWNDFAAGRGPRAELWTTMGWNEVEQQ